MKLLGLVLLSYLIGSIPFSYLFSRFKGHDVREKGTKNVGATNALVVAGPIAGALSLAGDISKGILPVLLCRYFSLPDWGTALSALAAIAGHDFSLFLGFRGGKGIATTGGVLLALDPIFTFLVILLWGLTMLVIRYFIPSTILVLGFLPIMMWMGSWRTEYVLFGVGAFLLALYVHRHDLQRFFSGNELTIQESIAKYRKK